MEFNCVSRTHVGLRRKLNEDAVLNRPERKIWAVADGMGGHEAGEVASALVVKALDAMAPPAGLEGALQHATAVMQSVNAALQAMAQAAADRAVPEKKTIGSTVVGLIMDDHRYACFWAGDSRGYLLRDGKIARLSRDHSMVQDLIDSGLIEAQDAEHHPNANVITRAVGAAPKLATDTVTGDRQAGDTFLLASDGLTRLVADAELAALLGEYPIEKAADRMIELTLERGAPDNVSLVIVRPGSP